mgnify:FL=1|jgi:hypothetical protein|tara:strand:+ start:251 stop:466 length:216 start_codon:yes stop_codon:yes gene_type:complete
MTKHYEEIGDNMVAGWRLVHDIIGFFLFLFVIGFSIVVGTMISLLVFGVVFFMYLWDSLISVSQKLKKGLT